MPTVHVAGRCSGCTRTDTSSPAAIPRACRPTAPLLCVRTAAPTHPPDTPHPSDAKEEDKALQLIEAANKRVKNMLRTVQHSHIVRFLSVRAAAFSLFRMPTASHDAAHIASFPPPGSGVAGANTQEGRGRARGRPAAGKVCPPCRRRQAASAGRSGGSLGRVVTVALHY